VGEGPSSKAILQAEVGCRAFRLWGWDGSTGQDYAKKLEDYAKAGDFFSLFSLMAIYSNEPPTHPSCIIVLYV